MSNFTGCRWRPLGLHGEILLRSDRVGDRRALERRADVEAPQLLERLVVVGDDPAVLQRREHQAAGRVGRARADLDVGDRLRDDLVVDRVERGDRAVVQVAAELALLALLVVDAAVRRQDADRRAVLREAAFGADAVGDVLDRVEGQSAGARCRRARSGRCASCRRRAARAPRDCRSARRASGSYSTGLPVFGSMPLGPVQIVDVLLGLDELAVGAIERVEEAVAPEVADDLALLAVDRRVVEHVDADLVEVPRVVRRVLEVPGELAGVDVERDDGVGVEVVAGTELRIVDRDTGCRCPTM